MLKNVKKRRRFDVDLTSFSSENDVKSKSKRRCFLTFFNKALCKNLQFAGMHFAGMQFCRHAVLPACSFARHPKDVVRLVIFYLASCFIIPRIIEL